MAASDGTSPSEIASAPTRSGSKFQITDPTLGVGPGGFSKGLNSRLFARLRSLITFLASAGDRSTCTSLRTSGMGSGMTSDFSAPSSSGIRKTLHIDRDGGRSSIPFWQKI